MKFRGTNFDFRKAKEDKPQPLRDIKTKQTTQLQRSFDILDQSDAIGVIDAIVEAIQRVERFETAERQRRIICMSVDEKTIPLKMFHSDQPAEIDTTVLRGMTTQEVENAIYHTKELVLDILNTEGKDVRTSIHASPSRSSRTGKKRENAADKTKPDAYGLFGSKAKIPFVSGLHNYIASVGSTQEKRIIALTAWAISVFGLIIALVFVTRDFLASRENAMTAVTYTTSSTVELPDLYLCNRHSPFPPFINQPNKVYAGEPTMWLPTVRLPGADSVRRSHPDPVIQNNIEVRKVNVFGKSCTGNETEVADPERFEAHIGNAPDCFFCFYVKNSPAIEIRRSLGGDSTDALGFDDMTKGLTVQVRYSGIVSACRNSRLGLKPSDRKLFASLITEHASQLQRRDIVDFGGVMPTNDVNKKRLFPATRLTPLHLDFLVPDVTDMYCNTILFSEYIYPSTGAGNISFQFNPATDHWERVGAGPYYPRDYASMYNVEEPGKFQLEAKYTILFGMQLNESDSDRNHNVLMSDIMQVYINGTQDDSRLRQVVFGQRNSVSKISFARSDIYGRVDYEATTTTFSVYNIDGSKASDLFTMHFTNTDFTTRNVSAIVSVNASLASTAIFFPFLSLSRTASRSCISR
jgi:hypothetical protein